MMVVLVEGRLGVQGVFVNKKEAQFPKSGLAPLENRINEMLGTKLDK